MSVDVQNLIERFLEDRDSLTEREMAELIEALRKSPELLERFQGQLVVDELLNQRWAIDRQDFVAQIEQRIHDSSRDDELEQQVDEMRSLASAEWDQWRDNVERKQNAWRWLALAAALLLMAGGVGGWFAYQRFGPVAHVMQFEEAPLFPHLDGSAPDPKKANARLCEWEIDLGDNANSVKRTYLDDITGEFPRLDERFAGNAYRHGYYAASSRSNGGTGFDSLVHHDFETGKRSLYELPDGDRTGEPVFVPAAKDAPEGKGYLLATIYRAGENRSDLAVFDAGNVADGPVACAGAAAPGTVRFPRQLEVQRLRRQPPG